ncbi:hypothetical protein DIPPA_27561 [Diplonema papillatum]|nr:hypothetical protein DIPPA_27561 [Diplonema papillatum]
MMTVEGVRRVAVEFLKAPHPALAPLDMGKLLLLLINGEKEKSDLLQQAMLKHGFTNYVRPPVPVHPPSFSHPLPVHVPSSSSSADAVPVDSQWRSLFEQQQQQLQLQQQQQAQMVLLLQKLQTDVQGLKGSKATGGAPVSGEQPDVVTPRVFPKEVKEVQALADLISSDPDGLVRDLEIAYVCGRTHLAGGELLETNFNMLRSWIMSVSVTAGWMECPDQLRLGNDLLTAVRMQRLYVEKGHSRRDIMRQIGAQATDPLDKAEAVLDAKKEKSGGKKMSFKPRTGNAKAGGK